MENHLGHAAIGACCDSIIARSGKNFVGISPSAVVFSPNPITGNRDEVGIHASWGLGESIVGGTVTPDTFLLRKSDLGITDRTIADKQRMTVSAAGGTREVEVPRFLRHQSSLDDQQATNVPPFGAHVICFDRFPL